MNHALKVEVTYTVRHILFFPLVLALIAPAHSAFAQTIQNASTQALTSNAVQEMQKYDPQAAQELSRAIQKGDFLTAQKIYLDFKNKPPRAAAAEPAAEQPASQQPSLFERTLSGDFPSDALSTSLKQFGYETFLRTASTFAPQASVPVGPDYIAGPGDQFTLTLWGTTEGIFTLTVTKEGNITLPKVGVIPVAGVRFGELERTIKRHLSRYYRDFNLSVAMGSLKTITIYVVGEVTNPGSYSLSSLTTVYCALFAAGGPTKKGTMRGIQVLRSGKVVKSIDLYDFLLRGDRSQDIRLQHEDTVFVPLIGPVAGVAGSVYRPAIYELKGRETMGDLIQTAGGIMPIAVASRVQLLRFEDNQKKVILDIPVPVSPETASSAQSAPPNELQEKARNMDVINVLPIYAKVWEAVNLSGEVRHPGNYQWRPDLKLREVIQQGQLLPTADLQRAEVIRLTDDFKDRKIIPIALSALMDGDEARNIPLRPKDEIKIYTMYRDAEKITVTGEVMRPATYEIYKGERLSDLLRRVGGVTREAYVYGAVFKRKNVKESQSKNLQTLISRLQSQILQAAAKGTATASSLEETSYAKAELGVNQELLNNLKTVQENLEGRVAITITENIDEWAGSKDDLLLQDGDSLSIPKRPQEVLVLGEVYSPGAQIYLTDMTVKDYIERTGGLTKYAEENEIFVVQANGFAFGKDSPNVSSVEKVKLSAGDVVFVPQKVERYAGMRFTKDIIDILFKTAVVLATITVIF